MKIKHLKRNHFFLVSGYANLIGVKTNRDRLRNSGEGNLEQGVQIFGFEKGKEPHRGFRCCPVIAFSFFCFLRPRVSKDFYIFALDHPFRVFTLEFYFLSIFIFSLSYYALENSSRTGEWFIKNFD